MVSQEAQLKAGLKGRKQVSVNLAGGWRNEELLLSVLVHGEGFERKRKAKLSIPPSAKAQLACDLHSSGISGQVLGSVP